MRTNTFADASQARYAGRVARPRTSVYLLCVWMLSSLSTPAAATEADWILRSNHVLTMTEARQHRAEPLAVAIEGTTIAWVGSHSEAKAWQGPSTRIVDYGDQALLPGFIDAHGHISFSALATNLANLAPPPVGSATDLASLQDTLRDYIEQRQIAAGDWVVGMGYDDSLLDERRHPTRDDLDEVSRDHPIMLIHVSGHLISANSKALARAGINAESPDPAGGVIRRRPGTQEPDGVLEETATYRLRAYMTAPNKDPVASLHNTLQDYAAFGITTAQDGASNPAVIDLLQTAAQQPLAIDVIAYPVAQTAANISVSNKYHNGFRIGGVKLILDGSPQGKTAFLSKPYQVPPPGQNENYRGYPTLEQAEVDRLIDGFLGNQIPVIAHANGDAAADMLIDAVSRSKSRSDHRTVMIHAQTVREDQLTQMKTLGMIPSYFSTHTFFWGDWHRDSVLGEQRASRISPTASTLARGMVFTVHNDAPIVPPDMIRLLWATANRLTRSGQVLGEAQRITTYQALRAITYNAAYQIFEEHRKGTLSAGKQADVVVLSENPLSLPSSQLMDLDVIATFARGKQVYAKASAKPL